MADIVETAIKAGLEDTLKGECHSPFLHLMMQY
jgi:hypothetical protein